MAYSTPLTATSNAPLTSAQWNASVRDNMLVTPAALATTTGRLFVATGANAIAERAISSAVVAAQQGIASVTFTDLPTAGPAVTVTTGANALVFAQALVSGSTNTAFTGFAVTVSGASTIAAADADGFMFVPPAASGAGVRGTIAIHYPGTLTPGSNTFTMKYRASAGTVTCSDRKLTVIGL